MTHKTKKYIEVRPSGSTVFVALVLKNDERIVFDSIAVENTDTAIDEAADRLLTMYERYENRTRRLLWK